MKKLILAAAFCALVSVAQAGDDKAATTKAATKNDKAKPAESTAKAVTDSWAKATGATTTAATTTASCCCDTSMSKVLMSPKMAAFACK